METGLGIAAGLGWGLALGLGIALMVALLARRMDPRPPAKEGVLLESGVEAYPFGKRA